MMRAAAPSTYILASQSKIPPSGTPPLLPIPLPTPSPPLLLLSTIYRAGVSEVTLLPRKRLCIALGLRFKVGESSSAPTARPTGGFRADYGFVSTLDDEIRRDLERKRMTDFVTTVRQDTHEIYRRLDDAQDDRSLMSGQLNMLRRDRHAYARTARLIETEARLSHEAWVQSMDASDIARSKIMVRVILELPRQYWLLKNLSVGFKAVTTARFKAITTTRFKAVTIARVLFFLLPNRWQCMKGVHSDRIGIESLLSAASIEEQ
ncbi:hypothetical protein Tco_0558921 [Tanacetum coccineum]